MAALSQSVSDALFTYLVLSEHAGLVAALYLTRDFIVCHVFHPFSYNFKVSLLSNF